MIRNKKELDFYIKADTYMNRGYFNPPLKERLKKVFMSDDIMAFLRYMRKCQYYSQRGGVSRLYFKWCNHQYHLVSRRLGFSIGFNVFGYGLVIPHYGTIVVGKQQVWKLLRVTYFDVYQRQWQADRKCLLSLNRC